MSVDQAIKYPEHEKLEAVKDKSQVIGEFLSTSRYQLCEYHQGFLQGGEGESGFMPARGSIEQILGEHFGIDLDAIEREKRQMLDELRAPVMDMSGVLEGSRLGQEES